jgi:hypothetical protein
MNSRDFFALLDEVPRTPRTLMVQGRQGEMRHLPISAFAGRVAFRSRASRFPRLERRRNELALLEALFEKEDR